MVLILRMKDSQPEKVKVKLGGVFIFETALKSCWDLCERSVDLGNGSQSVGEALEIQIWSNFPLYFIYFSLSCMKGSVFPCGSHSVLCPLQTAGIYLLCQTLVLIYASQSPSGKWNQNLEARTDKELCYPLITNLLKILTYVPITFCN